MKLEKKHNWAFVLAYPKTGSTSLAKVLTNIGIATPKDRKETYYFVRESRKEYLEYFASNTETTYFGEVTTTTIYHYDGLNKMHREFPNAKIIVLLRDPIQRAMSKYNHMTRRYGITETFSEIIRDESRTLSRYHFHTTGDDTLIETGARYVTDCSEVLDIFGKENVLFLLTEEMNLNSIAFVNKIRTFLDLPSVQKFQARYAENRSRQPHSKRLTTSVVRMQSSYASLVNFLSEFLPRSKFSDFLFRAIVQWVFKFLRIVEELSYSRRAVCSKLDKGDELFLQTLFNNRLRGLSKIIGVDCSDFWKWFKES